MEAPRRSAYSRYIKEKAANNTFHLLDINQLIIADSCRRRYIPANTHGIPKNIKFRPKRIEIPGHAIKTTPTKYKKRSYLEHKFPFNIHSHIQIYQYLQISGQVPQMVTKWRSQHRRSK